MAGDFEALFREEHKLLVQAREMSPDQAQLDRLEPESPGPAGEPWIRYTPLDRVGLALSGGGIRSATFNLGLLKALHELDVLKHVDYLSTVSGGGYIGAWWSAWRARYGTEFPETSPTSRVSSDVTQKEINREPDEVRHLREFSNFLSPRIGFFESEMWNAVLAVVSAMLPALFVAASVIVLTFLAWVGVTYVIIAPMAGLDLVLFPWLAPLVLAVLAIIVQLVLESSWTSSDKAERRSFPDYPRWAVVLFNIVLLAAITAGIFAGWNWLRNAFAFPPYVTGDVKGWSPWLWSIGIPPDNYRFEFNPHLFDASILWVGVALVLLVPRLLCMRFGPVSWSGTVVCAIDRALSRVIAAALIFAVLAALWLAGCWLNHTHWGSSSAAGGAVLSAGAFAMLRNWIAEQLGPRKQGGMMDILKPLLPQILAYLAIALGAACVASVLAALFQNGASAWCVAGIAAGIILFAIVFFDPAQVSMHSFYRNRLARAYLGASNIDASRSAEKNRQTDVRKRDDIELRALSPSLNFHGG